MLHRTIDRRCDKAVILDDSPTPLRVPHRAGEDGCGLCWASAIQGGRGCGVVYAGRRLSQGGRGCGVVFAGRSARAARLRCGLRWVHPARADEVAARFTLGAGSAPGRRAPRLAFAGLRSRLASLSDIKDTPCGPAEGGVSDARRMARTLPAGRKGPGARCGHCFAPASFRFLALIVTRSQALHWRCAYRQPRRSRLSPPGRR